MTGGTLRIFILLRLLQLSARICLVDSPSREVSRGERQERKADAQDFLSILDSANFFFNRRMIARPRSVVTPEWGRSLPRTCRAETDPLLMHALGVLDDAHGRSDRRNFGDLHRLSPPPRRASPLKQSPVLWSKTTIGDFTSFARLPKSKKQ